MVGMLSLIESEVDLDRLLVTSFDSGCFSVLGLVCLDGWGIFANACRILSENGV